MTVLYMFDSLLHDVLYMRCVIWDVIYHYCTMYMLLSRN